MEQSFAYVLSGYAVSIALLAGVGIPVIKYSERLRIRKEYKREFGQEPPEYFSLRDIRRQLEMKRNSLNP